MDTLSLRKDELVCSDWGSIVGRILVYAGDGHVQSHDRALNVRRQNV